MKKVILALAVVSAFSYNIPNKKETIQMAGAYKMLSQVVTIGQKDSAISNINQFKIYTSDYMMYANLSSNNGDTVSSFGTGSYTMSGGKVIENVIYGASDTSISTNSSSFTLEIKKTAKGYKQVIPDMGESAGQKVKLTEEYEKVSSATKSPLDGAWKQVKAYSIRGKDTTIFPNTQFKTYYAGHFIWGSTYKDSTNKNHTGIGFGTFKVNGNNKIRETVMMSTYSVLNGQSLDFDIKMKGNDEFQQTGTYSQGETNVELYRRVKK